jgi:hypothetical protein
MFNTPQVFNPQRTIMSDQKPEASKTTDANGAGPSTANEQPAKPPLEQLGALEDDDEFEVGSESDVAAALRKAVKLT